MCHVSQIAFLLCTLYCVSSGAAEDPEQGNPDAGPEMARNQYAEWKRKSELHLQEVRDQMSSGNWPRLNNAGQSAGDTTSDQSGPLQCLPVQRYRGKYLEGAPDTDVATCRMLIYTPHAAPHLEPFSADELFHCGHCALRKGMLNTGRYYFEKAKAANLESAAAAINYGIALQLSGDIAAAITEYRKALTTEPGNEVAAKNLAWASALSGIDTNVTRQLLLTAYEKAWVRLLVQIAGKARPTSFLLEQVLWPIGAFPEPDRLKFAVSTPPILGIKWELELHKLDETLSRVIVNKPDLITQPTLNHNEGAISSDDMLMLHTQPDTQHMASSGSIPKNVTAPASWHTLNIYEFGINRQLCADPSLKERHRQSSSILLRSPTKNVMDRAGELYLATVKRALVGLMDRSHTPETLLLWTGSAKLPASSLSNTNTATMSLSLATLNRLNHSHYLDPPFPGLTLATMSMMNHVQLLVEDLLLHRVEGDLLEAGVWRGGETILMRAILEAVNDPNRTVWVLDSFQGIPQPRDATGASAGDETLEWQPGQYQASLQSVMANFARFDLLDDRVKFIEGNFQDTLPTFAAPKLALLRLDADTYEATAELLKYLYHKVSDGGWIIIDDFHLNGARRAVLEFREENKITDPIFPVPEDYVFACGQHHQDSYHTWPKKIPQGAYWKKGWTGSNSNSK